MRLLSIPQENRLSDNVLKDLQIGGVFSDAAQSVLRYPCRKEEILARQALFATLKNEETRKIVLDCRARLQEAERAQLRLENAKNNTEILFFHADLIQKYLAAVAGLCNLHPCGGRFTELSKRYSSPEQTEVTNRLTQKVRHAEELLHTLSDFAIVCTADKTRITEHQRSAKSFYEQVTQAAGEMGLEVPVPRKREIRISRALSDGIEQLFAQQVTKLQELYADCKEARFSDSWRALLEDLNFLLEIHALTQKAASLGIPSICPVVSSERHYLAHALYDITLLAKEQTHIVPNDTFFTAKESFFFLTGANGGGKTSYLRAVGVNLLLFLAGCPIFARQASIYPMDSICTHFPADERFTDTGRLDEELARMRKLLGEHTPDTLYLLNEAFSGTDEKRGCELARQIADELTQKGAFGVFVTHFHTLEDAGFPMLSAVVDTAQENRRTYRIVRKSGEKSSYAADILKKYRLDEASLQERRATLGNQHSVSR